MTKLEVCSGIILAIHNSLLPYRLRRLQSILIEISRVSVAILSDHHHYQGGVNSKHSYRFVSIHELIRLHACPCFWWAYFCVKVSQSFFNLEGPRFLDFNM